MKTPSITALACCAISVGIAHAAPAKKAKKANWCVDSADITKAVPVGFEQLVDAAYALSDEKSKFESEKDFLHRLHKSADSICSKFLIMPIEDTLSYDAERELVLPPEALVNDEIFAGEDVSVLSFPSIHEENISAIDPKKKESGIRCEIFDVYGISRENRDTLYSESYPMSKKIASQNFGNLRAGVIVKFSGDIPFVFGDKKDIDVDRRTPFARRVSKFARDFNKVPFVINEYTYSIGVRVFGEVLYNDSTKSILRVTWHR